MKRLNRVGEKHPTKEGYIIEIIEDLGSSKCTIKFNDERQTVLKNKQYYNIKKGNTLNPNHPSVCNIGYRGIGKYSYKTHPIIDNVWRGMIKRCYLVSNQNKFITYKDVSICDEWKCLQNFAKWYEKNHKSWMCGWDLDKDILVKGNRIYSPETCCFVPHEINGLLINRKAGRGKYPIGVTKVSKNRFQVQLCISGTNKYLGVFKTAGEAFVAYKTAKENYIREVANRWKGKINPRVYKALYNHNVEIID